MDWLGPIREVVQPWYESSPRLAIFALVVVCFLIATFLGFVLFHNLFVKKPDVAAAPGPSGTTINFAGDLIAPLIVVMQGTTPMTQTATQTAPSAPSLIENGDFERGLHGWGTGFYEGLFLQPGDGRTALSFNNARARWYVDDRMAHGGRRSLRVEHISPYTPHVFSSFSQRIKVRPSTSYRVKYWTFIESVETGAFSLRVVPSRRPAPPEWDQFKRKVDPAIVGQWQERTVECESGTDWFFDLRFAAEGPIRAWIDDVTITQISG